MHSLEKQHDQIARLWSSNLFLRQETSGKWLNYVYTIRNSAYKKAKLRLTSEWLQCILAAEKCHLTLSRDRGASVEAGGLLSQVPDPQISPNSQ